MSDLTLFEFSDLKKEEIKIRLLEEYKVIKGINKIQETMSSSSPNQKNIKLSFQLIKTNIMIQLKSILLKMNPFLKTIKNNL